jgi:hypothetical protein
MNHGGGSETNCLATENSVCAFELHLNSVWIKGQGVTASVPHYRLRLSFNATAFKYQNKSTLLYWPWMFGRTVASRFLHGSNRCRLSLPFPLLRRLLSYSRMDFEHEAIPSEPMNQPTSFSRGSPSDTREIPSTKVHYPTHNWTSRGSDLG